MKKNFFVIYCVVLLISLTILAGSANSIKMGEVSIQLPLPDDYIPITPQMPGAWEFSRQLVHPDNQLFAVYIPESDIQTAINDKIPQFRRYFLAYSIKPLVEQFISPADFESMKETIKSDNDKLLNKVQQAVPDFMEQASKNISQQTGVDVAFSISNTIPLPPHEDTAKTFAFSFYSKVDKNIEGVSNVDIPVSTMTFVRVKGRLLILLCVAGSDEADWSRSVSKRWVDSIIAANPPDMGMKIQEFLTSQVIKGVNGAQLLLAIVILSVLMTILLFLIRKKPHKISEATPRP